MRNLTISIRCKIWGSLLLQLKTDFLGRPFRRCHQLADGIEYDLELGIIFLLQFIEPSFQVRIGREHLSQPDKSSHDLDIYQNSTLASQNTRKHRNPLLSERPR